MHPVRRFTSPTLVLFACALGAFGTWAAMHFIHKPISVPPPAITLENMGHLVSVKVNYANVIDFVQPRKVGVPLMPWDLSLGGTKILYIAKGDCTVASDLRQARYENIDNEKRVLTVVLPVPAPLQARVNHEARAQGGSYWYAISRTGLEPILPGSKNMTSAMDGALRRAQNEVEQACREPAVLATAKANAEGVLRSMFLAAGWKVNFSWKQ